MTTRGARAPAVHTPATPQLPERAVICILQHVPLHQRLSSCALVCCEWAAIAAAVPAVVDYSLARSEGSAQMQAWLGKHAGAVTALAVQGQQNRGWWRLSLELPVPKFTQLRKVHLSRLKVQLPAEGRISTRGSSRRMKGSELTALSSSSTTAAAAVGGSSGPVLPQLEELRLRGCQLTQELASQLLNAPKLTEVSFEGVQLWNGSSWSQKQSPRRVVSAVLQAVQQLPRLSALTLAGWGDPDESGEPAGAADLSSISNLQRLQHLRLELSFPSSAAAAAALVPAGLTALDLEVQPGWEKWEDPDGDARTAVCVSRFSQLQCFRGASLCMAPSTLTALTGLCELRLCRPYSRYGLRWGCQPEAEPLELLIVLQHLTLLQHLELTQCQLYYSDTYPDGFQPFSGLTASSHLTALILEEENSSLLPIEAFPYMFPAGRVLPHLEVLCLRRTRCFVPYYDGDTDEHADLYYDDLEPEQPFVEAEELELIAASCPALRQLALVDDAADQSFLNCQPLMQAAAQLPPAVTEIEGLGGWQRGSQDGHWMWPGFGELGMWLE